MNKKETKQRSVANFKKQASLRNVSYLMVLLLIFSLILALVSIILTYSDHQRKCDSVTKSIQKFNKEAEFNKAAKSYVSGVELCGEKGFKTSSITNTTERFQLLYNLVYTLNQDKSTQNTAKSLAKKTLQDYDKLDSSQKSSYVLGDYKQGVLRQIKEGQLED